MIPLLLFLLLSRIPEPLPDEAELGMFPGRVETDCQISRIRDQRETTIVRFNLAQSDREREHWGEEYRTLEREQELWMDLAYIHSWACADYDKPNRWLVLDGVELPPRYVVRMNLQDLRAKLGPYNYYHGQIRYYNQ